MYSDQVIKSKPTLIRGVLGPLALMILTPIFAFSIWLINANYSGLLNLFFQDCVEKGIFTVIWGAWKPIFFGTKVSWAIIVSFALFQIFLMRIVPGKPFFGPVTPMGNTPVYKANGFLSFVISVVSFCVLSFGLNLFSPSIVYDHFGEIIASLNIFSFAFCVFLYLKGRFAPSSTDSGLTGHIILDFYWGTELYPRIGKIDLKQFTNCRFGMMSWPIILLSFAAKQSSIYGLSDSMVVAVALQFIYIGKFFLWETGYLKSLDIMHDRAGYYICWGCLVWVPSVYTSSTLFLVKHPNQLGFALAAIMFFLGAFFILMNYFADWQRQFVRAKQGDCLVFGKKPKLIQAVYYTETNERKSNILLCSGFWGIARHFHYIPEILGALFWTMPALLIGPLPYFYVLFLTALLVDRGNRDDVRCKKKYQTAWDEYCKIVPYKMIPYIY